MSGLLRRTRVGERVAVAVFGLALAVVLALYALRGWFARYTADDYCTAGLERASGFIGAQVYWYETWSGRFSYYFVAGLVEYGGSAMAQVLPAFALVSFVGAGAWALWPLARWQAWPYEKMSALAASAAIVLACLQGAPDLDQALYWQTGMLTYTLPLILLTIYGGWAARRMLSRRAASGWELVGSAVLLFFTAGLAETSLAVQLALLVIATVLFLVFASTEQRRAGAPFLLTGVGATCLGAVVVVIAPGNYLHELRVTGSVHTLAELPAAFRAGIDFVGLFARAVEFRARAAFLVVLGTSLWLGLRAGRDGSVAGIGREWWRRLALLVGVIAAAWVLLLAAIVPGYFAQQWDVPERAQFVAVWVVVVALAAVGLVVGETVSELVRRSAERWRVLIDGPLWTIVLSVLALASLVSVPRVVAAISADAAYASQWDVLDALIRDQLAADGAVVVDHTLPPHFGFAFLTDDPNAYPNPCMAQFYGVKSISIRGSS